MHSILVRQLRKAGINSDDVSQNTKLETLLERIDHSYKQWDRDRALSERSLLLTSEEMSSLYDQLRTQSHKKIAREESQKKILYQAIEQAGSSILITNFDGTILYVNAAFTEITGYSAAEAIGQTPRILKGGKSDAAFYKKMWHHIKSGQVWRGKVIDKKKDGSLFPAMLTISPIIDNDGVITHFVGSHADLSELESLEQQFIQAQKMEAIGTLVGCIAHDFNNMLAGMMGHLYLAKKKSSNNPDVVKNLERVEKLGFDASDMVKQLLIFARKGIVNMRPFGLTTFIRQTSKLCRATIPDNIKFHQQLCPEELIIVGDANQLQHAILNLVNNARDAVADVSQPEISLTIEGFEASESFMTAHPNVDGHLFAHLMIKDNGIGIGDEEREHIFEPFFTTKEIGVGTGLGLPMVYGAVQSHGGVIEIDTRTGEGTTFHIYLPLVEETNIDTASDQTSEIVSGHGELILLVDDNGEVRSTGKEVLESLGYRVLEASDGLTAVNIFAENPHEISLIIMDVVMPVLGGVQAAERIRATSPDVKVIFATGYDKDETLKSEMPEEGSAILSKPYDIGRLSRMIRHQLDS